MISSSDTGHQKLMSMVARMSHRHRQVLKAVYSLCDDNGCVYGRDGKSAQELITEECGLSRGYTSESLCHLEFGKLVVMQQDEDSGSRRKKSVILRFHHLYDHWAIATALEVGKPIRSYSCEMRSTEWRECLSYLERRNF